jgi:alkylation response protein AidB-like acyl-CoA dehydrogenase
MRFELTEEQHGFARSIDDLLSAADTPAVVRSWGDGDSGPGLKLWQRLSELGLGGLLVAEEHGGLDAEPLDLVVAFEALGRHGVPGPWIESIAYLPLAARSQTDLLRSIAEGALATVAVAPHTRRALDADVAAAVYLVDGDALHTGLVGTLRRSVDPARRLFEVAAGDQVGTAEWEPAYDMAALACSAQLLGLGERLLSESVEYAKSRTQFGRAIGSYQALKHALADVRVGLDFARPLVYGAALSTGSDTASRDVSAAKVATSDSAYHAARTALQVHGAIGYTAEYDLGLWIGKVRALIGAWGTPVDHRARVLASLVGEA